MHKILYLRAGARALQSEARSMTSKAAKALPVIYAAAALKELDEIWDWNEKTYSRDHAAKYISFLEQHIDSLAAMFLSPS